MMGQFNATPLSSRVKFNETPLSSRVKFNEKDKNGLVLCDKYLPVEVLMKIFEIFCHANHDVHLHLDTDYETLLSCQLVCKRWKMLIDNIWHKKTERTLGKPFPWNDNMPLSVYYLACTMKPYERNLVRNNSGAEAMHHWSLIHDGGQLWTVEEPPVGMPELPQTESLYKDRQICFATSLVGCAKLQEIDLTDNGIHPYILDTYHPPIVVSEWYGCQRGCPADYHLNVQLFGLSYVKLIDEFQFSDVIEGERQNQWLKVSHVFEKYGRGLRRITFQHQANSRTVITWAEVNLGKICKTAGACVYVEIP